MKIYSENQVRAATFLASPVAGSILMAHNAKVAGQKRWRLKFYGVSIVALALMFGVGYMLPDSARHSANLILPLCAASAYTLWYKKEQRELLTEKFPDATKASWWTTIGISLLVIVAIFAVAFAVVFMAVIVRNNNA